MNQLQEPFYQVMTNLRRGSRAASTQAPKDDAKVTEIINGVIVSKPAKKIEYIGETKEKNELQPEVIDLQEYAKSRAASVPLQSINKAKVIGDFLNAKRY